MTTTADIISAAIRNERPIKFWYNSRGPVLAMLRTVSPYELSEDGETFLGYDHAREALRRFSLDNITAEDIALPDDEDYIYPIEHND
jgi:predicted DNA-binding transcriptional regulator YafY